MRNPDKNNKNSRIAHIGLPKTGTTFLQNLYFSKLDQEFFSTQEPFIWPKELKYAFRLNGIYQSIFLKSNFDQKINIKYYDQIQKKINKSYLESIYQASNFAEKYKKTKKIIISSEGLYGVTNDLNIKYLNLIKKSSFNKIIFIIRNQSDWIKSFWTQLIIAEDRFCKLVSPDTLFSLDSNSYGFNLDWKVYVDNIYEIFGEKNSLILPYELLLDKPKQFFGKLNNFMGITESYLPNYETKFNTSKSPNIYNSTIFDSSPLIQRSYIARRLSRKVVKSSNFLSKILSNKIKNEFKNEFLHKIKANFKKSNSKLESAIEIDLSKYNYY